MLSNSSELGDQLVNASYYNGIDFSLDLEKLMTSDVYGTVYRRPYIGLGWYYINFSQCGSRRAKCMFTFSSQYLSNLKVLKGLLFLILLLLVYHTISIHITQKIIQPMYLLGSERNCYVHLGFLANYKFATRL